MNTSKGGFLMEEGKRSKEYNKGYKDAEKDLLDKENMKLFTEGYKSGYKDGYKVAMKDVKKMMLLKVPPEIRKQMEEEGAQPQWPWPW
jgi:hypothetical protein